MGGCLCLGRRQVHDLHLDAAFGPNLARRDPGPDLDGARVGGHVARQVGRGHDPAVDIAHEVAGLLIERRRRAVENLAAHLYALLILPAFGLRRKIDDGIGGKTNVAKGTKIKAVLTVNFAIFTRTQFGAPFTLELIKSIEKSESEYLFDPEEDESHAAITDAGILGHLSTERVVEQF